MSVHEALERTDWRQLAGQKLLLLYAIDRYGLNELEGLVSFIDAIQDGARVDGHPVVYAGESWPSDFGGTLALLRGGNGMHERKIEVELTHAWDGTPLAQPRRLNISITEYKVEVMTGSSTDSRHDQGAVLEIDPDGALRGLLYAPHQEDPLVNTNLEEEE